MFRSYNHLHAGIYALEIKSTDNGSIVFRILINLVDNGDRFLVTVDVVAAAENYPDLIYIYICIYIYIYIYTAPVDNEEAPNRCIVDACQNLRNYLDISEQIQRGHDEDCQGVHKISWKAI
jgi:hypothetical protein